MGKDQRDRKWLARLSWANVAFLSLIFVCGSWIAESTAITTLIAYVPQLPFLVPAYVLLIVSFAVRDRRARGINVLASIIFSWLLLGINWPHRLRFADEGPSFTLMTVNAKNATLGWEKVREAVTRHDPDVICFQEGNEMGELPGYHARFYSGKLIASKERIVSYEAFKLTDGRSEGLEVKLENGVTVVSVQLSSFSVENVIGTKPLNLANHLQAVSLLHDREVERLISRYRGRPDVVIAGDFNCPPRGRVYNKMATAFNDAFVDSGWFTGYTFPAKFPLQRIDYAFVTTLLPQSARPVSTDGSDHRPVLFEFVIPRPT